MLKVEKNLSTIFCIQGYLNEICIFAQKEKTVKIGLWGLGVEPVVSI
jgi:hypothetical protein